MKRMLDEKNAALERMKRKLDEARDAGRGATVADRSEAARLTDRLKVEAAGRLTVNLTLVVKLVFPFTARLVCGATLTLLCAGNAREARFASQHANV